MYLNQCVEHMKVNRWILLQMSNHINRDYQLEKWWNACLSLVISTRIYNKLPTKIYSNM